MRKISVCFLGYLPEPFGGGFTYCYSLCKELAKLNVQVYFVDTIGSSKKHIPPHIQDYRMLSTKTVSRIWNFFLSLRRLIIRPQLVRRYLNSFLKFRACLKFREMFHVLEAGDMVLRACQENKIDIIHSHHAYPKSLAALIVGKYFNIPIVITTFCSEFTMDAHLRQIPIAKCLCQEATKVIAISNHTRNMARKIGITCDIDVILCGVDSGRFTAKFDTSKIRKKYNFNQKRIILYVGWLIERKGSDVLIRAMPYLESQENLLAVLIGPDHGFKDKLEELMRDLDLEGKVLILSNLPEEELLVLYSLAEVFIFPTVTQDEGFGLVAAEAMAAEIPVVASNIAAIPEVVKDGKTGFLFKPNNYLELANKVNLLLQDGRLRERMGRKGRERVQKEFNWGNVAQRVRGVYERFL